MIYLIGSLRNLEVPKLANELRKAGLEVFDNWHAAGELADRAWESYERAQGHTYIEALNNYSAWHVFEYDKKHLDRATCGVLMYPAGKSGHTEMGYLVGQKKPVFVLLERDDPEQWDVMLRFATDIFRSKDALIARLAEMEEIRISWLNQTWTWMETRMQQWP